MAIFKNDWYFEGDSDKSLDQLKNDFDIDDETLKGVNIIFASYTYSYYGGAAFVLFKKDGILYEVNEGHDTDHDSYYGLNGKWKPKEISLKELKSILDNKYCHDEFKKDINFAINKLCDEEIKK